MRMIDGDALEVVTAKVPQGMDAKSYMAGMEYVLSQIDALPTIEDRKTGRAVYQAGYAEGYKSAQSERKTGKWIKVHGYCTPGGDPVWACSECGKGVHVYGIEHGTYGADISDGQWKACPNCSALMEGEQV